VTAREGFYQCVELNQIARHSLVSVTTVNTLDSESDGPTAPTPWTPQSSPGKGLQKGVTIRDMSIDSERNEKSIELTRMRTFGEKEMGIEETWRMEPMPGRHSVGVAF
jgi:hypothetical protein